MLNTITYELPIDAGLIFNYFISFIMVTIGTILVDIALKSVGQLKVQAEIRAGGEEVLDDLDQGVIIL